MPALPAAEESGGVERFPNTPETLSEGKIPLMVETRCAANPHNNSKECSESMILGASSDEVFRSITKSNYIQM